MDLNPKYKAHRLQIEINNLQSEIYKHQEKCKHGQAEKKYGSNTGNYDPSCDKYWIDYYCPVCMKRWTEDQ